MFWLGAIVSLCYVPGVTGAYIATQWPVLAVLLSLGLLRSGPLTVFHWFGLAFIAYAGVRLWGAPQTSVFGFWLVLIMGLSLWLGTTLKSPRKLYAGLAAGAAVSSAVAVFQYFDLGIVARASSLPAGLFVTNVQLGAVLALIVVALVSERMWLWVLPSVPGVLLCGSRGAFLMLAVGLLGCAVRRAWVLGIVAVAGAVYFTLPLSPSDQQRMLIWSTAWHNLTWFGWGPGVFFTVLLTANNAQLFYPEYVHNDALQLVFEYGIAAALPIFIFAFALTRTGEREWPVVLAFVTAGCYSMPLFMPVASFVALVAVGRVLRNYGLVRNAGRAGRWYGVSRRQSYAEASGGAVSVASHY